LYKLSRKQSSQKLEKVCQAKVVVRRIRAENFIRACKAEIVEPKSKSCPVWNAALLKRSFYQFKFSMNEKMFHVADCQSFAERFKLAGNGHVYDKCQLRA